MGYLKSPTASAGAGGWLITILLASFLMAVSRVSVAEDIDAMLKQAELYLEAGKPRAAEIEVKNALQADPDNARGLLLLSRAYVELEHAESALRELERADLMGADHAQVLALTAHAYLQQQNYKGVLDHVHNDESMPKAGQANVIALRGIAELNLGHDDKAEEAFATALKLDPNSIEGHIGSARLDLKNRELDSAQGHVEFVTARDPNNVDNLLVAGELARVRNQYGKRQMRSSRCCSAVRKIR